MNREFSSALQYYCRRKLINHLSTIPSKGVDTSGTSCGLIDFDANLLHKDLWPDAERIVQQAQSVGVKKFVVPGSSLKDSVLALELARTRSDVISSAGIHPFHVALDAYNDENLAKLQELTNLPECSAIGETGLDFSEGFPSPELQIPWFQFHVRLAVAKSLPLFLHSRKAHNEFVRILSQIGFGRDHDPPLNACVHCFTGTTEELEELVHMGMYIGLTGYILRDFEQSMLAEWLQIIPKNRLVIETDAPYMGFKGCRNLETKKKDAKYPNVPSSLPLVARAVANSSCVSFDEVVSITTSNALRFFSK